MYNISEEEFEKALETILQSMKSPKKREFVLYSFNKNFIKKYLYVLFKFVRYLCNKM